MADKSTKTDDALLNGDLDITCPTTTNAATMTTVVATEAPPRSVTVSASSSKNHVHINRQDSKAELPSPPVILEHSGNPPRMSYAQVAQHHKEVNAQKEKHMKDKSLLDAVQPSNGKITTSTSTSAANTSNNTGRIQLDRDFRDNRDNGQQQRDAGTQQRHSAPNRGGTRGSHDRSQRRRPETRTSQLRDFVTPRSPK